MLALIQSSTPGSTAAESPVQLPWVCVQPQASGFLSPQPAPTHTLTPLPSFEAVFTLTRCKWPNVCATGSNGAELDPQGSPEGTRDHPKLPAPQTRGPNRASRCILGTVVLMTVLGIFTVNM